MNNGQGCTFFFFTDIVTVSEAFITLEGIREQFRSNAMTKEEAKRQSWEIAYRLGRSFDGDRKAYELLRYTNEWNEVPLIGGLVNTDDVTEGLRVGFLSRAREIAMANLAKNGKIFAQNDAIAMMPDNILRDMGDENPEVSIKAKEKFEQYLQLLDTKSLEILEIIKCTYESTLKKPKEFAPKDYIANVLKDFLLRNGVDKRVFLKPRSKSIINFIEKTEDPVALHLLWFQHRDEVAKNPHASTETLLKIARVDGWGDAVEELERRGIHTW